MAFLYDEFEIFTNLEPSGVYNKILSVVETQRFWPSPLSTTKPYFGEVGDSNFSIRKVKWNSRSILPLIVGKIYSSEKGSLISIRVRLNWFEFIFYMLIFGLIGHFLLWYLSDFFLANYFLQFGNGILSHFVPFSSFFISFVFAYLLLFIPVKFEAMISKHFFLDLLDKN